MRALETLPRIFLVLLLRSHFMCRTAALFPSLPPVLASHVVRTVAPSLVPQIRVISYVDTIPRVMTPIFRPAAERVLFPILFL